MSLQDSYTVCIRICIDWNIFDIHLFRYRRFVHVTMGNVFEMAVIILKILQETQGRAWTCLFCLVADPTVFSFPCLNSPGVAASQQLPLAASSAGVCVRGQFPSDAIF